MRTRDLPVPTDPEGTFVDGIHVVIEGDVARPAVALLHGIPGSVRDFRYLGPALVEQGLCAVRIDLPGFGKTAREASPSLRVVDRAALVRRTMHTLGFQRFAVAGHSFGGGIALLAAGLFPDDVSAYVGINSVGPRRHRGLRGPQGALRLVARLLDAPLVGDATHRAVLRAYKSAGLRSDVPLDKPVLKDHLGMVGALSFLELRRAAHDVRCPALVVSSKDDPLVEPASSFALARALRQAPVASHLHLERGGHFQQKHAARPIARWLGPVLFRAFPHQGPIKAPSRPARCHLGVTVDDE